jgi:hypothetical protein
MDTARAPTSATALLEAYKGMPTVTCSPFVHNHVVDLDGDRGRTLLLISPRAASA